MKSDFAEIAEKYGLKPPSEPKNMIIIGDPGRDLDDENAFVLAAGLHQMRIVHLMGIVANLEPSEFRARLAKGTMKLSGMSDIPVGIGSECHKVVAGKHEMDVNYLSSKKELWYGRVLLTEQLRTADDKSVILVLNSGLTDAAWLIMEDQYLFEQKVIRVSIMGGIVPEDNLPMLDDVGFFLPQIGANGAYNNNADEAAALFVHRFCQEHCIPMTILMREAAYACQMPAKTYTKLAATGNPVGIGLQKRNSGSMSGLWRAANEPPGSSIRGKLPLSRDRAWYINTFCGGVDPGISATENIQPFVKGFQLYDPLNLIAAIPDLRKKFYNPINVEVKRTTHHIIGLTKNRNGIGDTQGLRDFITDTETAVLRSAMQQYTKRK